VGSSILQTHRFLLAPLCDMLPLEYELMYRTGVFIRKCLDNENKIISNVTRNCIFFRHVKSPIGRNAQCWANFVGHSVYKMPVVNKKFMFQRVYDSLLTSVFERVGMLRELLCVRYGCCYQTLLSMDEMDFIVQFLCLQ